MLREYDSAKLTTFVGNPLAAFIRKEAVLDLERAAGPAAVGLLFAGSAGAENWADVPWLAAFDPVVTDSDTRGYYVVYLFHVSESIVHLSLNQGRTAVREEFGATARQVLSERAAFIRERLPDFVLRLSAVCRGVASSNRITSLLSRTAVASGLIAFNDLQQRVTILPWRPVGDIDRQRRNSSWNIIGNIIFYQSLAGAPEEIQTPDPQIRSLVATH